ncbi:MAG TPA: hypothetical protein V6D17_21830 [Candidatus Obscuribacterales bacterium]
MNDKTFLIGPEFDKRFVPLIAGHFKTLIKEASCGTDEDWRRFLGALREHDVSVFIRDLPHEEKKVTVDLADEATRRYLRKELSRPLPPKYQRVELVLKRTFTDDELEENALLLGWHWAALMFERRPLNEGEFHLDGSRIARDSVPVHDIELQHWLLSMRVSDVRHCLFNMWKPHVTAESVARLMRYRYYIGCVEDLEPFKEFERNLEAISERVKTRSEEASRVVSAKIDQLFEKAIAEQAELNASVRADLDAMCDRFEEEHRRRCSEPAVASPQNLQQAASMLKSKSSWLF